MNKKINLTAGVLISSVFIYFVFRNVSFAGIIGNIRETRKIWFIPFIFLTSFTMFLRGFRGKYFLAPMGDFGFKKPVMLFLLGAFANTVMPFRLGEFARAYATGKVLKISRMASLGVIFLERIFDGMAFLILLFAVSSAVSALPPELRPVVVSASFLFFGLFIFSFVFIRNQDKMHSLIEKICCGKGFLPGILSKAAPFIVKFSSGLSSLGDFRVFLKIFLFSLFVWALEGFNYYFMARAFGIPMNPVQGILVMLIVGMGIMIPSSPGFVGTYEYACVLGLTLLAVDKTTALSFAVLIHFIQIMLTVSWGVVSVLSLGLRVGDITGPGKDIKEEETG